MRIPQKNAIVSGLWGAGDSSDLQILLLCVKNVTAREPEAQQGRGREINSSEG